MSKVVFCSSAPHKPSVFSGTFSLCYFYLLSLRFTESARTPWGGVLQWNRREPRGNAVEIPWTSCADLCQDNACPLQHHRGPWDKHGWPKWRPPGNMSSHVSLTQTLVFSFSAFHVLSSFFNSQQSEARDISSSYILHVYLYCFSCIGMSAARLGL